MKNICVFCGSSMGNDSIYQEEAKKVGKFLAEQGYNLVYGAGNIGIMRVIADAMLEGGAEVYGIIPKFLENRELLHPNITKTIIVDSMSERKDKMIEMSDAFITLAGGLGTLDELAEVLTLNQLEIAHKPVGLINTKGFFSSLMKFFAHTVEEGFVSKQHADNIFISDSIEDLMIQIKESKPINIDEWIQDIKDETKNKLT